MPRYFDSQQAMDAFLAEERAQLATVHQRAQEERDVSAVLAKHRVQQEGFFTRAFCNRYLCSFFDLKVKGYTLIQASRSFWIRGWFDGFWSHNTVYVDPIGTFACSIPPDRRVDFNIFSFLVRPYLIRLWRHPTLSDYFLLQVGGFPSKEFIDCNNPDFRSKTGSLGSVDVETGEFNPHWRVLGFPVIRASDFESKVAS